MTLINMSNETITLIILAVAIIPILALMVYAIVVALKRSTKRNELRQKEISATVDDSQVELFNEVYGGKDNIKDVKREMGRIHVTVADIEKVQLEQLKELGANGVLLVGNVVKCSYGDRAPYIYNILTNKEGKNE